MSFALVILTQNNPKSIRIGHCCPSERFCPWTFGFFSLYIVNLKEFNIPLVIINSFFFGSIDTASLIELKLWLRYNTWFLVIHREMHLRSEQFVNQTHKNWTLAIQTITKISEKYWPSVQDLTLSPTHK